MTRRSGVAAGVLVAAALGFETWLLVGRRSGEPSYQPAAAVIVPSLEAAGPDAAITQTFVPGADGLGAVSFVPLLGGGRPRTPIDLRLDVDGSDVPMATRRLRPDELVDGVPFWWEVPRIERAAARMFTLRIAVPEAVAGQGLRVATGPPDYRWGDLRVGPRGQWGDLVFATRATQVHVLDTLRTLRRQVPWPLRTDGALVIGLLVLNAAAAIVIGHLAGAVRGGSDARR
ncbi:MAG: hypothetical protein ABIT71_26545 [Vicinamibacteraceae bacterium]